ncbi:MAG: hypothetical protein ABIZ35_28545 [Capsulimonas sp.]|uniref:PilN domain-containing protein n=1 Tax=Capsulimonas sp. TaxID=2494211 RepID=UPI003266F21C
MLRVNLLPGYVAQRRMTRNLTAVFSALFLTAVVTLSGATFFFLVPAQKYMENEAAKAEALKQQTDTAKSGASSVRTAIAPTEAKLQFVVDARNYNKEWARLYDTVARYTDPKMIYTDATVSGTALSIKAYAPSIAEVGRYLEAIYKEPDFQTVSIDKLPGYPEAVVNKYYLDGQLVGIGAPPVAIPGLPGAAGAGGGASSGYPGSGGGRSAGGPTPGLSGGRGGGGIPGGGGGGATTLNIDPENLTGERVATLDSIMANQVNPIGTPAQIQRQYARAISRIRVKQEPKGFGVTITAELKKPLTPPALPGGAGAAPATGGFPGAFPGGGPGGFPGGGPGAGRPVSAG